MQIVRAKLIFKSLLIFSLVAALQYSIYALQILAYPYIQPGNSPGLTKDEYIIKWITDDNNADFKVRVAKNGEELKEVPYESKRFVIKNPVRHYRVVLPNLDLDSEYTYEVYKDREPIRKASFHTKTKDSKFTFVVTGCGGEATDDQSLICQQIEKANPRFLVHIGDASYPIGLMGEYYTKVFPYYNKPDHVKDKGASLMSKIPFYLTYGNHDVSDGMGLRKDPDNFASFYVFEHPNNGPKLTKNIPGPKERVETFKHNLNSIYETATNYSFDYGNIHFIVLDGNPWVNPDDPNLRNWVDNDLKTSKAQWKIATIHQPPFCCTTHIVPPAAGDFVKEAIKDRDRVRKFIDLFQENGVDIVLNAHVHNYQRSKPIQYDSKTSQIVTDNTFNGKTHTTPNGIIYFITGTGGAHLHFNMLIDLIKEKFSSNPLLSSLGSPDNLKAWFNSAPYLAKGEYQKHSFTQFDVDGDRLNIKQIDPKGEIIDQVSITKSTSGSQAGG